MKNEFLPAGTVYDDPNRQRPRGGPGRAPGSSTPDSSHRGPNTVDLSKAQLVTWFLGSHEYLLQCIEAWATQITVRYGLDRCSTSSGRSGAIPSCRV